jgi:serine/threonine protein phosphatase PrpC
MSPNSSRQIQTSSKSDVGRVRSANQDVCGEFTNSAGYHLLVVADGMGGHRGGETASRLALDTIRESFESDFGDPETFLERAFRSANGAVHRTGSADPDLHGMGTTGVALLIGPRDKAWVAHVGDSRAYRLRGSDFEPITDDHSWVREEVRQGRLSAEDAAHHSMKNVLLRSIGVAAEVEAGITPLEVWRGDRYLLCTDGLWGEVDDPSIADLLSTTTPSNAVAQLVDLANTNGGSDNVTVQVAEIIGVVETTDGPVRAERRSAPRYDDAQGYPPEPHPLWRPPVVIAAAVLTAIALFWRVCA